MTSLVRKSNALVSAAYRLTVAEHRVIFCAIAKIQPMCEISDNELYTVSTTDLANCGINIKHCSDVLNSACEQLYTRSITVTAADGKEITTRWIQSLRDQSKTGDSYIELRFSKDIAPYLNNLTTQFTQFSLREAVSLGSAHAGRIFELLMQYKTLGSRTIELSKLRKMLGLEDEYRLFADFRKRCLDKSVEEINEKTSLIVKYNSIKTGRLITHIKFTFYYPKKAELPNPSTAIESEPDIKAAKPVPVLTDLQRYKFADLLVKDSAFQRVAKRGELPENFLQRIQKELKDDRFVRTYLPDLEAVGFKVE